MVYLLSLVEPALPDGLKLSKFAMILVNVFHEELISGNG